MRPRGVDEILYRERDRAEPVRGCAASNAIRSASLRVNVVCELPLRRALAAFARCRMVAAVGACDCTVQR